MKKKITSSDNEWWCALLFADVIFGQRKNGVISKTFIANFSKNDSMRVPQIKNRSLSLAALRGKMHCCLHQPKMIYTYFWTEGMNNLGPLFTVRQLTGKKFE